jgi:hypothetical protein
MIFTSNPVKSQYFFLGKIDGGDSIFVNEGIFGGLIGRLDKICFKFFCFLCTNFRLFFAVCGEFVDFIFAIKEGKVTAGFSIILLVHR